MSDDLLVRIGRRYGSTGLCMIIIATTILVLRWSIICDFDLLSVLITITLLILSICCSIVLITLMADRIEELEAKLEKAVEALTKAAEYHDDERTWWDDERTWWYNDLSKDIRTTLTQLTGGKDE